MLLCQTQDLSPRTSFFRSLETLADPRDNRGKRHRFAFVLGAIVLAVIAGRAKMSSIQRFIANRIPWLRRISQMPDGKPISRAHLPRLVAWVDWEALNQITQIHFGVRIELQENGDWVAVDGKCLRGATTADNKQRERVVLAVPHGRQAVFAQQGMQGPKSSEVTVARNLLRETGLEKGKVTLDALHCNPTTTAQIHQAGGTYLTQVKENQPTLRAQCQSLAVRAESLGSQTDHSKGHGRIATRSLSFFSFAGVPLAKRWAKSGLQALIVVERQTVHAELRAVAKEKTTHETSYYLTNQKVDQGQLAEQKDLAQAIRRHWGVESDNWIRDVTFGEDQVRTKSGNQAHIMARLRTLAIDLFRKAGIQNFQAAIETFVDCPDEFEAMLQRVGFL
jgi:predicted transposase YbfD/YdcC